jgi:hypothetical protein
MKRIAICFFGVQRSTRHTYTHIKTKLYDILDRNGIQYDVYVHAWIIPKNTVWRKTYEDPVDFTRDHNLLCPTYAIVEEEQPFIDLLKFSDYYYEGTYEWVPSALLNFLCSMESQRRVLNMAHDSYIKYDAILLMRPDMRPNVDFDVSMFDRLTLENIILLSYNGHEGVNDKFAVLHPETAHKFGNRIMEAAEYRKNHGRIVGESYTKFIAEKYYKPIYTDCSLSLIRPDGSVDDF